MKEIIFTTTDELWQEYKDAIGIQDEYEAESAAKHCMYQALLNKMRDAKHPETGLTKQQMTHYRRGESAAKAWYFNRDATREEFEEAGRKWSTNAGSMDRTRELILKGWMSKKGCV